MRPASVVDFARQPALRSTLAWCLYDFANSSYTTIIITVAFAVYFRQVVVAASDNRADQLWGIANFMSMLAAGLLSPLLGAIADRAGARKRMLVILSLLCVTATVGMARVGPGDIALAILLFVIGTFAFEASYVFYNAFLPEVSTPRTAGRISGWAWGLGYIGGLICLLVARPWLDQPLSTPSGAAAYRTAFLITALWFLVFALPSFVWLPESTPHTEPMGRLQHCKAGFVRVWRTLSEARRYPQTVKYLVASLFFTDAITTVIAFAGIYATTTIGFSNRELVWLFLLLNLVAFPGSLLAGYLADHIGPRRAILLTLVLWIVVTVSGALSISKLVFWVTAVGAALGTGSTQAVGRSFMSQLSPLDRQSEFFGFYALTGKFASMFGPLVFGTISHWSGSQRLAVLSLVPFFVTSAVLVGSMNERQALSDARR